MTNYRIVSRVADGIRRIDGPYGVQLWTSILTRRSKPCEVCGLMIAQGERAWSPLTFGQNRMHRVHGECFA